MSSKLEYGREYRDDPWPVFEDCFFPLSMMNLKSILKKLNMKKLLGDHRLGRTLPCYMSDFETDKNSLVRINRRIKGVARQNS